MIYILAGNDTKKKNTYINKLSKGVIPSVLDVKDLTREALLSLASSVSLFSDQIIIRTDGLIKSDVSLDKDELEVLSQSRTVFIFTEDKLLSTALTKYKKFATIENFILPEGKPKPKINTFDIALYFGKKEKLKTWILYKDAISSGVSPEEISGILFWKIKSLLTLKTKVFSDNDLKKMASRLVSLYHDSHLGKTDFNIGLEQFILSSLEK
ncbi:MAG: hypothetical protein EOM85_03340 [Candidatus Moranbacteria bacterium]|nr:hypothetical protein [Candidatus Moranbacteria bacterium]